MNTTTASQRNRSATTCWIEAMRLRTLPVSVAGVIMAGTLGIEFHTFRALPWAICLVFALLCQIASNFANEYFDFRDGLDKQGRVGPRRGVAEGDITPSAMLRAAIATLAIAAIIGCTLIYWGGWWLVAAGVAIILGALAYSTGPYPLSRHGWGEVAVVIFFGIVPVTLTFYVMSLYVDPQVWISALSIGLLGANVLIVNNYRDIDDDRTSGKRTLTVAFGRRFAGWLYFANGVVAIAIMLPQWRSHSDLWLIAPIAVLTLHIALWRRICHLTGSRLNPMLGATSMLMLGYTLLYTICVATAQL